VNRPGRPPGRLSTEPNWSEATAPDRPASRSRKSTGEGRAATRTAILDAAERLFAEQGILAVSNRQIGAAAGRGDTSVVGYYFESKADLVRALIRRFNDSAERLREKMLAELDESDDLRDWVECLVLPYIDLLEAAETPSWHARFGAQVVADPTLSEVALQEATSPTLQRSLQGLARRLPDLAPDVLGERTRIARHVMVQTCAERERALADGLPVHRATWRETATVIVDALIGLWTAPVSAAAAGRRAIDVPVRPAEPDAPATPTSRPFPGRRTPTR
jgi:AcrR family transcriptional regulator